MLGVISIGNRPKIAKIDGGVQIEQRKWPYLANFGHFWPKMTKNSLFPD